MSYWSSNLSNVNGTDIKVKFTSTDGDTKFMNLSAQQFESIKDLMLSIEEPMEMEQRVVFRKFPHDGAIIALFPDQYNKRTGDINSYMELGQHAETAPDFGDTVPATHSEYFMLMQELVRQGYTNLKVVKRFGKLGR